MPKIRHGLKSIKDLKIDQYAWTTKVSRIEENMSFRIIDDSEIFKPWILIIRED